MKSVIELVKTAQGYSVVQDGIELNKISNRATKQKQFSSAPKKFVQQNFTIYPYTYAQEVEIAQKYIILPSKSQWFNLNQIHEIQRKALPQWFKTKKVVFGAAKPDKFEKNQELYKKYRNYIVDLGRNSYVSATAARRGLAGDVCAIIRIHSFLQRNGIINYVFSKKPVNNSSPSGQSVQERPIINLTKRKDCIDRDKLIFEKHFDKDYLELMKKINKYCRPFCHLCQGVCGVIWYEYHQQLCLKSFEPVQAPQQKNGVKSQPSQIKINGDHAQRISTKGNQIVKSSKPFHYLLCICASCFTSGTLPIVLSYNDFKKVSVVDSLVYEYEEPKDKKKINQQNKLIEVLEKNKFNLKKTSQQLKLTEKEVFSLLMCLPVTKIQKLARIDQQSQNQNPQSDQQMNGNYNHVKSKPNHKNTVIKQQKSYIQNLVTQFETELKNLDGEEEKLYEQLIQLWLLKIFTKVSKLSDWEKSTRWFASRLIHDQRNSLAELLKYQPQR